MNRSDIDTELVFDRALLGSDLATLQDTLVRRAPAWARGLHVHQTTVDQRPIDTSAAGSLIEEVFAAAGFRGETYRALAAEHLVAENRFFGSVELRGASPELTVILSLDSPPLFRMRDRRLPLGNRIVFQLRDDTLDRVRNTDWVLEVLPALAVDLGPVWGSSRSPGEYRYKVMSPPPKVHAIGRDFARFLPGL